VDRVQDLLRRLALNDEGAVASALADDGQWGLDPKSHALVRIGALVALGATPTSYRLSVERAYAAGATDDEILGVLGAVGQAVGFARVVAAAPDLALALGYDIDAALDTGPLG
jgi:alkylhydroperoxidase/carboxymuconolactone decarboxylase family protein YurZ